jgi:predicted nucleic acid-binding protein
MLRWRIDTLTRNTRSARLGFGALVDVGIIVLAHFRNPARKYAAQLLLNAFTLNSCEHLSRSIHHHDEYLKRRSDDVAKALLKTVSFESPAFYGNLPKAIVEKAIATTSELSISLWDSYLVELAKELRIDKIYTIDEEMARKVKDLRIENPILTNVMKEYHQYIREK